MLSYILCDLDPKVKVLGKKTGICAGVPSTAALVQFVEVKESQPQNPEFKNIPKNFHPCGIK